MSKTIVHADDSASVRRWVAEQLSDPDLKVVSVADGEAALDVLKESPCDLLLTDLEMPNLDGLGLVAAVRDLPMHRFLPVLVLSSHQPGEYEPQHRQGVTGWLVKPIDPGEPAAMGPAAFTALRRKSPEMANSCKFAGRDVELR